MVGLIWFVQLVHYPLFSSVGNSEFATYETQHTRRTSWVVGVFMPTEAVTGVWLVLDRPEGVEQNLLWLGGLLLGAVWLSTALWQAPLHRRLTTAFDTGLHRTLVYSNWLRTALWSLRGALVLVIGGQAIG